MPESQDAWMSAGIANESARGWSGRASACLLSCSMAEKRADKHPQIRGGSRW
jgi:hypothetical protein